MIILRQKLYARVPNVHRGSSKLPSIFDEIAAQRKKPIKPAVKEINPTYSLKKTIKEGEVYGKNKKRYEKYL